MDSMTLSATTLSSYSLLAPRNGIVDDRTKLLRGHQVHAAVVKGSMLLRWRKHYRTTFLDPLSLSTASNSLRLARRNKPADRRNLLYCHQARAALSKALF